MSYKCGMDRRSCSFALVALVCACTSAPEAEKAPSAQAPAPVSAPAPQVKPAVLVAAASDLTRAFTELGAAFEQDTGQHVEFTYGSTGLLARQISEGAPFDVFAAANVSFVDELVKRGACDGATRAPYARGRIAVWTRSDVAPLPEKFEQLGDARYKRIAIANPEHAPYGKAAKEALEKLKLWKKLEPRIVYGENVRQTLQFAESGNAEAAVVALSLVIGEDTPYLLVDDQLHEPIDQALVVCKHGKAPQAAVTFASYVNAPAGRAVMRKYGFVLPGETLSAAAPGDTAAVSDRVRSRPSVTP
jgi:molybdate transport system substrate-binding protein